MDRFTFCSLLRCQTEREAAVTAFRVANWKEARFETHDAELFLPAQQPQEQFDTALRSIIITSHDLASDTSRDTTWQRMERLYHLSGSGKDAVIVFILRPAGDPAHNAGSSVGMNDFMKLQSDVVTKDLVMPIIPSSTWADLPQVLTAFHHQLCVNRPHSRPQHNNENTTQQALHLLRQAAVPRPLSEHSVHVLSDLTPGFRNYLEQLAEPDARQRLLSYLEEDGQRALTFWLEEHKVY